MTVLSTSPALHAADSTADESSPDTTGNFSSGPSPTLHLLGVGKVGQAFLERLDPREFRLVAATDSSATLHSDTALVARELLARKRGGASLASTKGAEALPLDLVLGLSRAAVVVDALPSVVAHGERALQRCRSVLGAGKKLVLASKDALAAGIDQLVPELLAGRVGIHAALGGTGRELVRDLASLRDECREIAIVANASTTALVLALEQGLTLGEGIARCQAVGVLEPDPTLDLDGTDAATKLAIVARAVFGRAPSPFAILREDVRALDPELVRRRCARGASTRLVGRVNREGELRIGFEEVPLGSVLRVPADRVVYAYVTASGAQRVHVGHAIGAERTAEALLADLRALTGGAA